MDSKALVKYEARAKVIKALAHSTRLLIIDQLAENGEECVRKLTEMVGVDISTVSRHLAVLKGAGIVADEKRGAQVYYRLRVPCIVSFFGCVEKVLESNAKQQQELVA